MASVAALVVAAILGTNFHFRRVQLLQEFQAFVRGVAGTTALALNGDAISSIHTPNDAALPSFLAARRILDQSRQINGLAENELYILRPISAASPFETEFVVMLQKKTFIGSRYTLPLANRAPFLEAWKAKSPTSSDIYEDENGRWISGYAPVLNRAGEPVAMIEADARISRFIARQREELLLALAIGCGAFFVAMIPGLLLARSITRGLNKLSAGIRRFQSGEHDVQVHVGTGDELQHLGKVFNEMIISLGEKLALLPYVSRFTAEAVRRSRKDPQWLAGMEQEVIVLFADLRGFTSWCETREASFLVRELNRLLAVQADAVVSAGGDVDKFIGDAVMAVFPRRRRIGREGVCLRTGIGRLDPTGNRGGRLAAGAGTRHPLRPRGGRLDRFRYAARFHRDRSHGEPGLAPLRSGRQVADPGERAVLRNAFARSAGRFRAD